MRRFGLELRVVGPDGETVLDKDTRFAGGPAPDGGVLLPVLRDEAWPHLPTVVHRRLLGSVNAGPWVTLGLDTPGELERVSPDELERRPLADLERLETDMFAVSVPQWGSLLAIPMTGDVGALCQLARQTFESSTSRRISPWPIVIAQGEPAGFARPRSVVEPPRNAGPAATSRPWWRFW